MLQNQNLSYRRLPIKGIRKLSVIDKVWMLWAICLIDFYANDRKQLAPANIEANFGVDVAKCFFSILPCLEFYGFLDSYRMKLKAPGAHVARNWKAIAAALYSL